MGIPFTSLPAAISLDGSEIVPIVQGGSDKRTTTGAIANTATGFVPTTRLFFLFFSGGFSGGHSLATDVTLGWTPFNLTEKTALTFTDVFGIGDAATGDAAKVTFPNAMKATTGLPALLFPNATNDYFPIVHATNNQTNKVNPSAQNHTQGNMPAGSLTSQVQTKATENENDTTWT